MQSLSKRQREITGSVVKEMCDVEGSITAIRHNLDF